MSFIGSQSTTMANVASSASSVLIFDQAGLALGRAVFNDSTAVLYLAFTSAAASTSNYTVQLAPGGYYEFPHPVYSGQVTGIWASANGNARTTAW